MTPELFFGILNALAGLVVTLYLTITARARATQDRLEQEAKQAHALEAAALKADVVRLSGQAQSQGLEVVSLREKLAALASTQASHKDDIQGWLLRLERKLDDFLERISNK